MREREKGRERKRIRERERKRNIDTERERMRERVVESCLSRKQGQDQLKALSTGANCLYNRSNRDLSIYLNAKHHS